MLTMMPLLIAQFPVHSDPSFFFQEVLSTLQKIVLTQSAVLEGLFVICSVVSIISTDNTQQRSPLLPEQCFLI